MGHILDVPIRFTSIYCTLKLLHEHVLAYADIIRGYTEGSDLVKNNLGKD